MPQRPPDLDAQRRPVVMPPKTRGVVSENEPGSWGGGFLKGLLGDKQMMRAAGIAAAGAMAPVTGGSSLWAIPAMAAGGAIGSAGANAVRRGYGSGSQDSMASDVIGGATEGAMVGAGGPLLKAGGRALEYLGKATTPYTRRMLSTGGMVGGLMSGNSTAGMGAGAAIEALLNPKLAPRLLQSVGDAASIPTVKRTIEELTKKAGRVFSREPSMASLAESSASRTAAMNKSAGFRRAKPSGQPASATEDEIQAFSVARNAPRPSTPTTASLVDDAADARAAAVGSDYDLVRKSLNTGPVKKLAQEMQLSPAMRSFLDSDVSSARWRELTKQFGGKGRR